jgi:uncharacterized protein (TIGR00730 family)
MQSVCVFCGSGMGARSEYREAARQMGLYLAAEGLDLVYGGASIGLMGLVADAVLAGGGRVHGFLPEPLAGLVLAHPGLTELTLVASMHERKAAMAMRADAFIALPGGLGTLEEFFEILTGLQLGLHQKPCSLLNVAGFFDGLLWHLDHATQERFVPPEHRALPLVDADPRRLVERLRAYQPLEAPQLFVPSQV